MPSVTHPDLSALASGKKRRRDDNGSLYGTLAQKLSLVDPALADPVVAAYYNRDKTQFHDTPAVFSNQHGGQRLVFPPASRYDMSRKVIPLPASKRRRALGISANEDSGGLENGSSSALASPYDQPQQHFPHAHPEYSTPSISPQMLPTHQRPGIVTNKTTPSSLLSACHICYRKPTRKSDLDSYAHCMGCGERTCFVCMRECQGWPSSPMSEHRGMGSSARGSDEGDTSFTMQDVDDSTLPGPSRIYAEMHSHPQGQQNEPSDHDSDHGWSGRGHRQVICSRCCIERGSEGDVVCLGCLAGMEGV